MHPAVEGAHRQLIERLIARGCLWSPRLITAFRETPRHLFLDRIFYRDPNASRWKEYATRPLRRGVLRLVYSDRALTTRLSSGRASGSVVPVSSSSQPSLMAEMLEDLQLQDGNRTLEIGAGTGYNAALLARAAGPVISVDVDNRVVEEARRHLQHFPDRAVHFVSGDGRSGWQSGAPYDRVVVTAASPDIQPAWISQTSEGGIIQVPLALAPGLAFIARGVARNGTFVGRLTRQAYFIALRSHDAAGDEVENESALPEPTVLEPVAAPWQDWCPRQPQQVALPFIRAIAFLGWLKGMSIGYRATREEGILFGIADPASDAVCWLGQRVWRVDGREGRAIGEHLWHLFLESGGPAPTEFMLSAATDRGRLAVLTDTALSFQRTGAFTEQLWELKRDRVRPIVD